jgi:DNA repair exonuclease SbcCD ATPase subunit
MNFTLELNNFKTFEKFLIKLPSTGLVLLDGVSGKGKTTIVQAIVFAVNGFGKKLASYGTKKVRVDLTKVDSNNRQEFKIIRQKSPDSLVLVRNDKEYHDDEAQVIINELFGSNFNLSSVIFQKGTMSFLSLTPKEKMLQIESILFSDFSVESKKNKLKKIIKSSEEDILNISSKIETYENVIKLKHKYYPSELYSHIDKIEDCEKIKEDHEREHTSIKLSLKDLQEKVETLRTIFRRDDENTTEKKILEQSISSLENNLEECMKEIKEYEPMQDISSIKEKITNLENNLKHISLTNDFKDEESRLEKTTRQLTSNVEEEISKINIDVIDISEINSKINALEIEYEIIQNTISCKTRINGIEAKIQDRNKFIDADKINIDDLNINIKNNETKLEELTKRKKNAELSKLRLNCPCCKASLKYISSSHILEVYNIDLEDMKTEDIESEITSILKSTADLKQKSSTLKKIIDSIESLKRDRDTQLKDIPEEYTSISIQDMKEKQVKLKSEIESLREQKNKITFNKNRLKQLEGYLNDIKSRNHPVIKTYMDKIKEIKMELSNIQMKNLLLSDEEINNELTVLKEKLVLSRNNHIKLQKLQEKKSSITTQLENKKEVIYSIIVLSDEEKEKYNKDLYNTTITIEKLENDLVRINNTMNMKELETQINFIRYSNELNELNAQIEENKKRKLTITESLDKYNKISKSIEISESKLVYRFIDTLNERVNYHLETMFYDPLTVNITCFKDTKKGEKPHIDFVVYYKGNETDISNLSGGEFDRLNLAFLLSFNELSDSGVIILDEALSSLNQELVADIIEHIQDTNKNNRKLVLMTLHQSIKGMFDQVISL